jgi:hypothetical protein
MQLSTQSAEHQFKKQIPKLDMQEYTFTLTGGNGRRFQGFCRKFLPPKPAAGSKLQLPQVMCLVSEDPWHAFFFKVRVHVMVLQLMVTLNFRTLFWMRGWELE